MPAIDLFRSNIAIVRNLVGLAQNIDALTAGALQLDEIYRSVLAMAVSALDHYVHEKALEGMLEVATGARSATDAYKRFPVRLDSVATAIGTPGSTAWLSLEIRTANGFRTFQKADDIADALRPCSGVQLWPRVAGHLGTDAGAIKSRLDLLVDRRNKIVHEFDTEPTGLGIRWPITETMATDAVDLIERIGEALEVCV